MNKAKIESFRQQLLAMRRVKLAQFGLPAADTTPALTGDAADAASFNGDLEQTLNLHGEEKHSIEEIEAALARIESGEFGACEECGQDIPEKRLQAVPHARLCVPCQERLERESPR